MKIVDVWIDVKSIKPGRILGRANVEIEGKIFLQGLEFCLEYDRLKVKLPPNIKLDELQKRKVGRAVAEELLDELRLGLITL